jgi:hypothetical protein
MEHVNDWLYDVIQPTQAEAVKDPGKYIEPEENKAQDGPMHRSHAWRAVE